MCYHGIKSDANSDRFPITVYNEMHLHIMGGEVWVVNVTAHQWCGVLLLAFQLPLMV
jgi:hypothetical protein